MLEETTEKASESTRIYPLNPRAVLATLRSEDGSHNITRPNGRLSPTHPAARGRCQLSKARAIDSEEVAVLLWDEEKSGHYKKLAPRTKREKELKFISLKEELEEFHL